MLIEMFRITEVSMVKSPLWKLLRVKQYLVSPDVVLDS